MGKLLKTDSLIGTKMKIKVEKYRIVLSRCAALIILFFLCSSKSYWDASHKTVAFFFILVGIILVAVATLGRMWCSVYIAGYKDEKLITKGPYSICRNPLYFFSMVGMVGVTCFTETFLIPIICILFFSIYYPFVIKSEEKRLSTIFGNVFENYKKQVPQFFPQLSAFEEPDNYNMNPIVYRRHIFSAIWFVWIVGILEAIERIKEIGLFGDLWILY